MIPFILVVLETFSNNFHFDSTHFQVGISCSYMLWALSSNFFLFVLARFVGGLSKGNISLSMAIITDVSNVQTRGKAMALVGIAFSIGFIIGPMIGAMFSIFSNKTSSMWFVYPAMFALLLSSADLLFVYRYFEESLPKVKSIFYLYSDNI